MTFVATLRIYGIASRNFILILIFYGINNNNSTFKGTLKTA